TYAGTNTSLLGLDADYRPRNFGQTDVGAAEVSPAGTPAAAGSGPDVLANGGTTYTFQVVYTDDTGINTATLGADDVTVTGPNAFSQNATLVSSSGSGTSVTATYRISIPGGWAPTNYGTHTINVNANAVTDTAGNPVP